MKRKVKVAIFHCGFIYSGGGERIVLEEAKGLTARGYGVEVFAPTLHPKLCYPKDIQKLGVKTFLPQLPEFVPGRHALWMVLSSILAPLLAFRFLDIDVFIGANQPGAWIAYCVAKVLRKPYIVYMNQPNRLLYPRDIDEVVKWSNLKEYYFIDNVLKRMRKFLTWADTKSFTGGSGMLVNGRYIGEIIKKVYKKKTIPCPAGAHPRDARLLRLNPTSAYKRSIVVRNISGKKFLIQKPFILLTNRHQLQKRFEYGIEAFRIVRDKIPGISLVIPGPFTSYTKEVIQVARENGVLDAIYFLDHVSEEVLQKLYQEAVVYIYTAPEEDFGMGIIESMAWGVPVVAWNNAGPTVTVENGKTGYLANKVNIEDFAQKIISILNNPLKRSEMGKNAWEHVKNNFSWDNHNNILEKTIQQTLTQHERQEKN